MPLARRALISFWLTLLIAVSVKTLLRPASHTVFPIFAQGSIHWWGDVSLYSDYAPLDYFRYPPLFAILMTPLAFLGNAIGGVLWTWLTTGLFILGLSRLERYVLPGSRTEWQKVLFHVVAGLAALRGIWNAQSNALIIALVLLGAVEVARQRWWWAAFFLSFAVSLKLTPLPFLLLLCGLRPRQLILRSVLFLALFAAIPFATRPPTVVVQQYRGWIAQMQDLSTKRWPGFRDGWTVCTVIHHMASGQTGLPDLKAPFQNGQWYRAVQVISAFLVFLWVLNLKRNGLSEQWALTATLAITAGWMMILGPATEHATYAILGPFLAWGVVERGSHSRRWLIRSAAVLILLLGWGAVTAPFVISAPWLLLALPLGSLLYLLWLLSALHNLRSCSN